MSSLILLTFLVLPAPLAAQSTIDACGLPSTSSPVLNGIDIVSVYEAAVNNTHVVPSEHMGTKSLSFTSEDGFVYYFESQSNLDKYTKSPSSFEIGAGGYCALAISGSDPACDYGEEGR